MKSLRVMTAADDHLQQKRHRVVRRPCEFSGKEIDAIRRTEPPPEASAFDLEYQRQLARLHSVRLSDSDDEV
jgi:hypothetical protein